ncbi:unnamed protein product [Caenorhabditis auriculariae]|uniref:Major facilitator superfamily (MFS) profile domain-containing protein n=1 Tax=Caenorhabditis auriculariae TaxID=2777116 RepID=A0A8S1HKR7_9PELO|nr:unnamed protein product [Caenorhabditis auriculariae]
MRVIVESSWPVVFLMGLFSLIQSTQTTMFVATMYPYMKKLHAEASEHNFGIIVTTAGIGHCIGCAALGYWSSVTDKMKWPMMVGFVLTLASNFVYLMLEMVPRGGVFYILVFARFLAGLGLGNTTTMRTCAVASSSSDDRSKAMAVVAGGRALGVVVGPALQLIFLLVLGEDGISLPIINLHSNNAPAVLGIILTLFGLLFSLHPFVQVEEYAVAESMKNMEDDENYPEPDRIAMFVCVLTRYVQHFTQIGLETLAPVYIMMMFSVRREEAVGTISSIFLATGVISSALYIAMISSGLSSLINTRKCNIAVLLVFIGYLLSTYQWHFLQHYVKQSTADGLDGGCDFAKFPWCWDLNTSSEWVFFVGYMISFGACVPFLTVTDATLFSKLLNPLQQAAQQSLFDISSTFAKVVAPVLVTAIYTYYGPRRVWEVLLVQLIVTAGFWIGFSKRMVPLHPKPRPVFTLW